MLHAAEPPPSGEPPLIEMRRAPAWLGGRFRRVSARRRGDLPLWARIGLAAPGRMEVWLVVAAVLCAGLVAAGVALALWASDGLSL